MGIDRKTSTLSEKMTAIGRRSPKDLHMLDVLADLMLDRLGPDLEPAAYHWKCDEPRVTKKAHE
jgi:hypothetical protein